MFGDALCSLLSQKSANIIGSLVLIVFGLYMLKDCFKRETIDAESVLDLSVTSTEPHHLQDMFKNPEIVDADHSKNIEFREAIVLGLLLCLNNVGLGIGASITGLNLYSTSIASILFSLAFIPLGCYVGSKLLPKKFSKLSNVLSALIILVLGIYELFF
jgi:putative sporulation protein YtaF